MFFVLFLNDPRECGRSQLAESHEWKLATEWNISDEEAIMINDVADMKAVSRLDVSLFRKLI